MINIVNMFEFDPRVLAYALSFISALFIVLLVYVLIRLLSTLGKSGGRECSVEDEAYSKAMRILDNARLESLDTLKKARERASEIISKTTAIDEEVRGKVEQEFKKVSRAQLKELDKVSTDLLDKYRQLLKQEVQAGVGEFKEAIRKETVVSHEFLEDKMKKEYEILKNQLDSYRDMRMKSMDQALYDILAKIATEVIGKNISLDDNESMIMKALEESKKEGFFFNG